MPKTDNSKCHNEYDDTLLTTDYGATLVWTTPSNNNNTNGGRLYLGPQRAASRQARQALQQCGIAAICNCTADLPNLHNRRHGTFDHNTAANTDSPVVLLPLDLPYCQVPVHDVETANLMPYLPGACAFLHHFVIVQGKAVLVHCQFGQSRSAAIVLAFLIMTLPTNNHNCTLDQAYRSVQQKRPEIHPNAGFWKQLQAWETALHGNGKKATNAIQIRDKTDASPINCCHAWFVTHRDLPPGIHNKNGQQRQQQAPPLSWQQWLVNNRAQPEGILRQCWEFVWERGFLTIDLDWLKWVVCQEQQLQLLAPTDGAPVLIDQALAMIMDPDSSFSSRHDVSQARKALACRILLEADDDAA